MKRLLGLVYIFFSFGSFAQMGESIGNPPTLSPASLSLGAYKSSSKLILQKYCNDSMLKGPGDILFDLYYPNRDLSFSSNRKVVVIYNPHNLQLLLLSKQPDSGS